MTGANFRQAMWRAFYFAFPTLRRLPHQRWAVLAYAVTALAIAFVILSIFLAGRMPWHDGKSPLDAFHAYYNLLMQTKTYPSWVDYGVYGYPIYFLQNAYLTHAQIVVAFIGYAFSLSNTLALYFASIFINHFIFITGCFLLGTALFRHWAATGLLVIVAGLSTSWLVQTPINFTMQHHLPLALYFFAVGLRRCSIPHIILSGLTLFVFSSAALGYFISIDILIYILLLTALSVLLKLRGRKLHIKQFFRSARSRPGILSILILLGAAVFLAAYMKLVIDNTELLRVEVNPGRITVPLSEYLSAGGLIGHLPITEFITGYIIHADTTLYFGMLPFSLFLLGVIVALRNKGLILHKSFLFVVLGLVGLTAGGATAAIFYFSPLMQFYHNIGNVYSFARLFMIISAAFAFDYLLVAHRTRVRLVGIRQAAIGAQLSISSYWRKANTAHRVVMLVVVFVLLDIIVMNGLSDQLNIVFWARVFVIMTGSLLLLLLFARQGGGFGRAGQNASFNALMAIFLTIIVGGDLMIFQFAVVKRALSNNREMIDYYRIRPFVFHANRMENWSDEAAAKFARWQRERKPVWSNVNYETIYPVFGVDPCVPHVAVDVYERSQFVVISTSKPVADLVRSRGGRISREKSILPDDPWLRSVLACGSPKVVLASNVMTFETAAAMQQYIATSGNGLRAGTSLIHAPGYGNARTDTGVAQGEISVNEYSPSHIDLSLAGLQNESWITLSIPYHPGWRAMIDGKPREPTHANGAFIGVPVKPGDREISLLFYDSYGLWMSKIYAGIGVFGVSAVFLLSAVLVIVSLHMRRGRT